MNWSIVASWTKKVIPVVVALAVGRGWLDQAAATTLGEKVPEVLDAVIIIASALPTIISSVKTHGKKDASNT